MRTESKNDVENTLLHKREVSSEGYIRTDGLFNIEGTITDKKSYDIEIIELTPDLTKT